MIGRLVRSPVVKIVIAGIGLALAYIASLRRGQVILVTSKDQPVKFTLKNPVPLLDKDGNVHEVGFLFPTEHHNQLVFQTSEPVIRCKDDTHKFSHKVLNHTETGLSSTIKCIQVFQETSAFGLDAVIRKHAENHEHHNNKPEPPATLRAIMSNTAGEEGMCVTDGNKKTCIPSVHIMDFDFLPPSVTEQNATRWGGTMEEVSEAMEMAERDLTRAEKACQKAIATGKTGYKADECTRKATIAVQEFARSVHKLGQATAMDKHRIKSDNIHALFGNRAAIPGAEVATIAPAPQRSNNATLR